MGDQPVEAESAGKKRLVRFYGAVELAVNWIRHYRIRSILAVIGITIAVILTVTLGSVGYGVTTKGADSIDLTNRDFWMTNGGVELRPGGVGSVENPIRDAHQRKREAEAVEGVRNAEALGFYTVYVSDTPSDFATVVGAGITGSATEANFDAGDHFQTVDIHYNNGNYNGSMTREVLIDQQTAAQFDVGVGDRLYIGSTIFTAKQQSFRVVGITPTFSRFLGTSTVTLHLSELQEVSGTTRTDSAAIITVTARPEASAASVQNRLKEQFPEFTVRTNDEQVRAVVGRRATLLTTAGLLVVVAAISSIIITANILALVVQQQRKSLATAIAMGVRSSTLAGAVLIQGALFGTLGAIFGCLLSVPAVAGVNYVTTALTGFETLLATPYWLYILGSAISVTFGILGALSGAYLTLNLEIARILKYS